MYKDVRSSSMTIQSELILEKKVNIRPRIVMDNNQNHLRSNLYERVFPVDKIKDGSIIKLFNKTPKPTKKTDVICPHFYELKWANGCNFNCAWCYLNGTYRFLSQGKKPHLKNIGAILEHLDYFFENIDTREFLLNSGELSDSLLFENDRAPLTKKIIPRFMNQDRHKLLILTKSTHINNLLKIRAINHVIVSFSLNSFKVADRWEKAPKVLDRIKAAKKLYDMGYKVRVRIDPMVPIKNWLKEYILLTDVIFENFIPERITFGSLRGLQSTINNSKDISWTKYLTESSNWGKKIDFKIRHCMYSKMIEYLDKMYRYNNVALCKETVSMWNDLNIDHKKIKCNCIM